MLVVSNVLPAPLIWQAGKHLPHSLGNKKCGWVLISFFHANKAALTKRGTGWKGRLDRDMGIQRKWKETQKQDRVRGRRKKRDGANTEDHTEWLRRSSHGGGNEKQTQYCGEKKERDSSQEMSKLDSVMEVLRVQSLKESRKHEKRQHKQRKGRGISSWNSNKDSCGALKLQSYTHLAKNKYRMTYFQADITTKFHCRRLTLQFILCIFTWGEILLKPVGLTSE